MAACAALLVASKQRIPFSCSAILTMTLIEDLVTQGFIERTSAEGCQLLRYDRLRFKWICEEEPSEAMVRQLVRARATAHENEVVGFWAALAACELQDYLGYLLSMHGLPTRWSIIAFSAATDLCDLTLSQMRYVMWYAVRAAASTYLVSGNNEDQTHADLQAAMRRRADYLATGVSQTGKYFLPAQRHSALLTIFLEDIARIATGYWTLRPVASSLRGIVGEAGAR